MAHEQADGRFDDRQFEAVKNALKQKEYTALKSTTTSYEFYNSQTGMTTSALMKRHPLISRNKTEGHRYGDFTEYRWDDFNEQGERIEHRRFSHDPITINITDKPMTENDKRTKRVADQEITINDKKSGLIITYDRVAGLYPRHFRINGKPADNSVEKHSLTDTVAVEGNPYHTEESLLEALLRKREESSKQLEWLDDPEQVRVTLQQLMEIREKFNAMESGHD